MTFRLPRVILFISLCTFLTVAISCKKDPVVEPPITPVETGPVQYETPFAEVPNTSDLVVYEINERAFSAAGNLNSILPRLDSIKALGVNVIWLMPIHPIGVTKSVNSPYCVKNYLEVNPEYGNLEDLRKLVREAHNRKMAVVLDWVANHTAWDNPWIAKKAWYTQDAAGNIIQPAGTNWADVADLNFDNADMRLEMIKAMKYWVLAANVDGYRCDGADYVPAAFWKQAIDTLKNIPNRKLVLLAEGSRQDQFDAGFQINFGWSFFDRNVAVFKNNQSAANFYQLHQGEYAALPAGAQKLRFTSNHDKDAWEDTPLGFFGGKRGSMSAFVITAYLGGIPLLYNGQEVGCSVKLPFFSRLPIDWSTNPDMFKEYKSLMSIRAAHPALRTGSTEYYANFDVVAFKRTSGTDEAVLIANTRNAAITLNLAGNIQNTSWKNALDGTTVNLGTTLDLGAYQYWVLVK